MNTSTSPLESITLFSQSWERLKEVWRSYYQVLAVFFGLALLTEFSLDRAEKSEDSVLLLLVQLASICILVVTQSGLIYILLRIIKKQAINIEHLFSQKQLWVRFFIASIAYQLLVGLGLILLIVPGIYWLIKYSQYGYLLIDKQLTVSDAFKQSVKLTDGLLLKIFEFMLIALVINVLGLAALGIGVVITIPVTLIAFTLLYKALLDRSAAQPETSTVKNLVESPEE